MGCSGICCSPLTLSLAYPTLTSQASSSGAAGSGWALRLRGLQHPLLQANYLKQRQQLEKEVRLTSGRYSSSSSSGGGGGGGSGSSKTAGKGVMSSRNLGTRREVVAR